jgi:hypothetical protein
MASVDPSKWAELYEDHFGKKLGRLIIKLLLFTTALAFLSFCLGFFLDFYKKYILPWASGFSIDTGALGDITWLVSAAIVFAIFATAYGLITIALARIFKRRMVPQNIIDDLSEFRSEAISVLNNMPKNDDEFNAWEIKWTSWREGVRLFLEKNFTKSEALLFGRLGIIPEVQFGFAYNDKHAHCLKQLAKQITILENLINRHLERH